MKKQEKQNNKFLKLFFFIFKKKNLLYIYIIMDTNTVSSLSSTSTPVIRFSSDSIRQSVQPMLNLGGAVFVYFWAGFVAGQIVDTISRMVLSRLPVPANGKSAMRLVVEVSLQIIATNIASHVLNRLIRQNAGALGMSPENLTGGGVLFAFAMLSGQSNLTSNVSALQAQMTAKRGL